MLLEKYNTYTAIPSKKSIEIDWLDSVEQNKMELYSNTIAWAWDQLFYFLYIAKRFELSILKWWSWECRIDFHPSTDGQVKLQWQTNLFIACVNRSGLSLCFLSQRQWCSAILSS